MRIRSIKPELFTDEKTAALSDRAFRLFVALISGADDEGRGVGNPILLRARVWAMHGIDVEAVTSACMELSAAGLAVWYQKEGQAFYFLPGWSKHQRINRPQPAKYPPVDGCKRLFSEHSVSIHGTFSEHSVNGFADDGETRQVSDNTAFSERSVNIHGTFTAGGDRRGGEGNGRDIISATSAETPTKAKRKCRLPDDWQPNDKHREKCKSLGIDCARQAEKFADHHVAVGSRMADWDRAFHKWLNNAADWGQTNKPSQTTPPALKPFNFGGDE